MEVHFEDSPGFRIMKNIKNYKMFYGARMFYRTEFIINEQRERRVQGAMNKKLYVKRHQVKPEGKWYRYKYKVSLE